MCAAYLNLDIIKREIPSNIVPPGGELKDAAVLWLGEKESEVGRMGLTYKKTPYVENPADLMLILEDSEVSQLTDFTTDQGVSFFRACGEVATNMASMIGEGKPFIALNQQADCTAIPFKFAPDGTELKVQTIDNIHAHIFIETGYGENMGPAHEMTEMDQVDFMDPYGIAVGKLFQEYAQGLLPIDSPTVVTFNEMNYPLGLTFTLNGGIKENLSSADFFNLIQDVQRQYVKMYRQVYSLLTNESGQLRTHQERKILVEEFLKTHNVTDETKRDLLTLCVATKNVELEERKQMRLVRGPALTWVIYEDGVNTKATMIFRIVSRGNATDALGIWVEPKGIASEEREMELQNFYGALMSNLGNNYNVFPGPAYKIKK